MSIVSLFLLHPSSVFQADALEDIGSSVSTYLSGLLRPTREGAQGRSPSAIQAGAGGLLVSELYWSPV